MYKSAFSLAASKDDKIENDLWSLYSANVKLTNVPKLKSLTTKSTINYTLKPKYYPLISTEQIHTGLLPSPNNIFTKVSKNELCIIEDSPKVQNTCIYTDLNKKRSRNLTTCVDQSYCLDKILESLEDLDKVLERKLSLQREVKHKNPRRSTQPILYKTNRNEIIQQEKLNKMFTSNTPLSETKKSKQNANKKYVSLSNILSEKTLDAEKNYKEEARYENKLVDIDKLLSDLNITVDEELKIIDESEKNRQKNFLQTNEIIDSINWNYSFKNRHISTRKPDRKNKHQKLIQLFRPILKRNTKKKHIKIKNLSMVQNLVTFRYKFRPENFVTEKSIYRPLIRNRTFKDAIRKRALHRNGILFIEKNSTSNQKLMDLQVACKWLIDAGFSDIVHSVLNKTSNSLESILNDINAKNLHECDFIAIKKRLEILYSSINQKFDRKYLIQKIFEEDEEDDSTEEEYLECLETDLEKEKIMLNNTNLSKNRYDQRTSLNLSQKNIQPLAIFRHQSFRLDDKHKMKKAFSPNLADNSLSKSFLDLTNPKILESDHGLFDSNLISAPTSPNNIKQPSMTVYIVSKTKRVENKLEDNLPQLELKDETIVSVKSAEMKRERRDSRVGGSLTRDIGKRREKWPSFVKSHRPSLKTSKMLLTNLNVKQIAELKSQCFIKIEGKIEEYYPNPTKNAWNRLKTMPKFIKRHQKSIDHSVYKNKIVFGVPLKVNYQRYGQPLPQAIIQIMKYIRKNCFNTVGLFRRSGSKVRMNVIRELIEKTNQFNIEETEKKLAYLNLNNCPDLNSIGSIGSGLSSHSTSKSDLIGEDFAHNETMGIDLADILKQYFRDLPECLLSNKQSQNLIDIFTYLPENDRLEVVQFCMVTLDDEYRESIQCLLYFLHDISKNSKIHKMDARNLAICLAPTLFNLNIKDINPSGHSSTPPSPHSIVNFFSKDTTQLMSRQCNSSSECLAFMIENSKKIFQIPTKLKEECSYLKSVDSYNYKITLYSQNFNLNEDLNYKINEMYKELRDKSRWKKFRNDSACDIYYKQIDDHHPLLRLWKLTIEIESSPTDLRNKILRARGLWDEDLLESRVIEQINEQTDIFQYVMHFMAPQPSRDFCELRYWTKATSFNSRYSYFVMTYSIEHEKAALLGDLRAVTLRNFYLIEKINDNKCKVHQLYRGDLMGFSSEWYKKMQVYFLKRKLVNLRETFSVKF